MSQDIDDLIELMRKLRDPEKGCPWDVKQDFRSIAPCTIEEAYEVVEAIEADDYDHLREELGDLLLQVIFHAQMATEKNLFTIDDVARVETEKMIDRHPHVFGDRVGVDTASDVLNNWEADKANKRAAETLSQNKQPSALDGVNVALPALSRSLKLQKRASRVGFDWNEATAFIAKIREEMAEFEAEVHAAHSIERMEDELGDVLFAVIGLAAFMKLDPERALRHTNRKFENRFRFIENALSLEGKQIEGTPLPELEKLWLEAKKQGH